MAGRNPSRAQLKQAEFLKELEGFAEAQRELIQAQCDGFDTDPAMRAARVARARTDYRFFCRTYFPHYVNGEESVFHAWLFDNVPMRVDMPKGQLMLVGAPRGEAKTTLGVKLMALWCIVTERKHFMPVVSDSWDQSAIILEAIKTELTDNTRLRMDWPAATGRGRVWKAGVFLSANNRKMEAFGTGKAIRGISHGPYRPDFVFIDDIENDDNVRQVKQRNKLEALITSSILNLGPPEGTMDVMYVHTVLHYDSTANRFHRKPRWVRVKFRSIIRWPDRMDLWDEWERLFLAEADPGLDIETIAAQSLDPDSSEADRFYLAHKAEMDAGAQVSWPQVRPLIELMKIRAEDHRAFDREHQNDPTNEETAVFTNMVFWIHPDAKWEFYGVLDPSLGKSAKGDPSALLVGGFRRDQSKLSIVEADVARIKPEKQYEKMLKYHLAYRCKVWGVESTAFQEYFRQRIVADSAARGFPLPAVPIENEEDKDLLIEAVAPHANNGLILFHQRHTTFNLQVRHYPEADHDDGPDALQMLWKMCIKRMGGIPRIRGQKRKPS